MKKLLILFTLIGLTVLIYGQSLNPEVISTSGDYFENSNASLSWTLGETVTETFENSNFFLTQGFQQPVIGVIISGISLDLLVYLEGPYNGSEMTTDLNTAGLIPLTQPFNQYPWNYSGTESVNFIPNLEVVDWVLIELRDASDAPSATEATVISRQAGFLLKDGTVVGTDGSSLLQFDNAVMQQLFVIVWHRNHLGIITADGVTETAGIYFYDFSISGNQVYGGGYKEIGGVWGMVAGDSNQDRLIDMSDKNQWSSYVGQKGYIKADFNLDAQADNKDKNEKWYPNQIFSSQIPQ